ncbi:hypothetical protein GF318_04575 [Candidatus Micrarchaeota archaeon]|nr:hypothetical protein [Candidatus Micrarchaeota archaeon]
MQIIKGSNGQGGFRRKPGKALDRKLPATSSMQLLDKIRGSSNICMAIREVCHGYVEREQVKSLKDEAPLAAYACARAVQKGETDYLISRIFSTSSQMGQHQRAIVFSPGETSSDDDIKKNLREIIHGLAELYHSTGEERLGLVSPATLTRQFQVNQVNSITVLNQVNFVRCRFGSVMDNPQIKKEISVSHGTLKDPLLRIVYRPHETEPKQYYAELTMSYSEERTAQRANGMVVTSSRKTELTILTPPLLEGNGYYLGKAVEETGNIPFTEILPRSSTLHQCISRKQFLVYGTDGKMVLADIGPASLFQKINSGF